MKPTSSRNLFLRDLFSKYSLIGNHAFIPQNQTNFSKLDETTYYNVLYLYLKWLKCKEIEIKMSYIRITESTLSCNMLHHIQKAQK